MKSAESQRAARRRYEVRHRLQRNHPRGNTKERDRKYRERNREMSRASHRDSEQRRRTDPAQRARDAIARRFRHVMAGTARVRIRDLGYSIDELRTHIASLFLNGMSWENYGEWHIDHRRPVSSFKLPEQARECWSLANLQPLWAVDNLKKGNRHDAVVNP
jgi:hypothetical protein